MTTLKKTLFSLFVNIKYLLLDRYILFQYHNGFLVNFDITYSLKLVFAWVNISRILRTRLL